MKVKNVKIGEKFELMGYQWKVLDITEKGHVCLMECMENDKQFDKNSNDWKESSLRKYLNEDFYSKLAAVVGEENIIPFERDLLSLDGLKEYGTCEDKVSLISFDEYRKYRELIPGEGDWYWTLTPDSTKATGYDYWVAVVSPSGVINYGYYGRSYGVRPFCIFSSSIFESEE